MMLPKIPYENGAQRIPIQQFGGLDRRAGAGNGAIIDMLNLTGDDFPVLSSRLKYEKVIDGYSIRDCYAVGSFLIFVSGQALYRSILGNTPQQIATLPADSSQIIGFWRQFAAMGTRLVIWPDKYMVDTALGGSSGSLTSQATASCTFEDGEYAGEPAEANTIKGPANFSWATYFKVGDGVTISGAADQENNITAIVREIDGNELRFYENTFVNNSTATNIAVKRSAPDMDYIFSHDNRIWGCRGDTIYCSKLGDPYNWNVFDGLSTDSWSVETGTPGGFTGAISFMGYPMFFKEDRVFKVYGNRPSNFEVVASASLGVLPSAWRSMAIVGDTLYYLSRAGFVRYNGGFPAVVDAALNKKYTYARAGSDGKHYYVHATSNIGVASEQLIYSPETGMWHKERLYMPDSDYLMGYCCVGGVFYGVTGRSVFVLANNTRAVTTEAFFESEVTFADFDSVTINKTTYSFASKYPVRLWLRYESEKDLTVKIKYNGGTLETVATLASGGKTTQYLPVPIRRCDRFGIEISTAGAWKLYAMEIEVRAERTNRKGG